MQKIDKLTHKMIKTIAEQHKNIQKHKMVNQY